MNEAAKKKLLQMIPHALYVLTSQAHGKTAASTMSWVNQASFKPPMISVGIKSPSYTGYSGGKDVGGGSGGMSIGGSRSGGSLLSTGTISI